MITQPELLVLHVFHNLSLAGARRSVDHAIELVRMIVADMAYEGDASQPVEEIAQMLPREDVPVFEWELALAHIDQYGSHNWRILEERERNMLICLEDRTKAFVWSLHQLHRHELRALEQLHQFAA